MNRAIPVLLLAAAVFPAAGCNPAGPFPVRASEGPVHTDAPIRTDRNSYRVRSTSDFHEITIGLTFRNTTEDSAYIPTCRTVHPPTLQKWENGEWVNAYSPVVLQCLGEPVVVEAGAEYEYTYHIEAGRRSDTYPTFAVAEIPGTYRLNWHMLRTWTPNGPEPGLGEVLPEELRISNSFQLTQ